MKQRATESKAQYFRRLYKKAQGDTCQMCEIVETDSTRRHTALVECEAAHGLERCGKRCCSHHFVLKAGLPVCAKCNNGVTPTEAEIHALTVKLAQVAQATIFDLVAA